VLLNRRLPGPRRTTVRRHTERAAAIAQVIYCGWQTGPYQWQAKYVRWYLGHGTQSLLPGTRYRYWLTIRPLMIALKKEAHWQHHLYGLWQWPTGESGTLKDGRPIKRLK
jgi:hypothetical protein